MEKVAVIAAIGRGIGSIAKPLFKGLASRGAGARAGYGALLGAVPASTYSAGKEYLRSGDLKETLRKGVSAGVGGAVAGGLGGVFGGRVVGKGGIRALNKTRKVYKILAR